MLKRISKEGSPYYESGQIPIFSVSETIGFKDQKPSNLLDNWFSSGNEQFDSIFLFSFTEETNAEHALELIKKYNAENETGFPIHAFIIPVDKSSYTIGNP